MKNIMLVVGIIFISLTTFAQKNKPKDLLDKVSNKMKNYNNVYITFKYILDNTSEKIHQVTQGNTTIKGELYNVNFLGTTMIFDGKKIYTIIPEDEEVNISDNEPEDDTTITPSKFYTFYQNGYTFKWDKLKRYKGKKIQYIKLIPNHKVKDSDVKKILIGIDLKTTLIYKVIEYGKNGTSTTLLINSIKPNQTISDKLFIFDQKKYENKGYTINQAE